MPVPFTKSWSTAGVDFRLREDGLVFAALNEGVTINRDSMKSILASAQHHLGIDHSFSFILEVGAFTHLTPDAGQFAQTYSGKTPLRSLCIVSDSLSVRLAANFYQAVFKPEFAFKLVEDVEEAVAWSLLQRAD